MWFWENMRARSFVKSDSVKIILNSQFWSWFRFFVSSELRIRRLNSDFTFLPFRSRICRLFIRTEPNILKIIIIIKFIQRAKGFLFLFQNLPVYFNNLTDRTHQSQTYKHACCRTCAARNTFSNDLVFVTSWS